MKLLGLVHLLGLALQFAAVGGKALPKGSCGVDSFLSNPFFVSAWFSGKPLPE